MGVPVLYMRLLRQVVSSAFFRSCRVASSPWFSSTSGAWTAAGVIILGSAWLPRKLRSVLNAEPFRPATNVYRARFSQPGRRFVIEPNGRTVSCLRRFAAIFSRSFRFPCFVQPPIRAGSKWLSLFQSPRRRTASLRATAVRAFFGPILRASFSPQLFKADWDPTVVRRQLAAS